MMQGIHAVSAVQEEGKDDEPLFSNAISLMRVDNMQAYMANYEKNAKQYSELLKSVNSPMLPPPTIEKSEVGRHGRPAKSPPNPHCLRKWRQCRRKLVFWNPASGPGGKMACLDRPGRRTYGDRRLWEQGTPGTYHRRDQGRQAGLGQR